MKRKATALIIVALMAFLPVLALGATAIEGSIQGFYCVTQGISCPVGKEDPVAAAERLFVLHVKDASYYFVPNVDRAVMARHINERVRITGDVSKDFKAIQAAEIEVNREGKWIKVWSSDWQDEIYKEVLGSHPLGGV